MEWSMNVIWPHSMRYMSYLWRTKKSGLRPLISVPSHALHGVGKRKAKKRGDNEKPKESTRKQATSCKWSSYMASWQSNSVQHTHTQHIWISMQWYFYIHEPSIIYKYMYCALSWLSHTPNCKYRFVNMNVKKVKVDQSRLPHRKICVRVTTNPPFHFQPFPILNMDTDIICVLCV